MIHSKTSGCESASAFLWLLCLVALAAPVAAAPGDIVVLGADLTDNGDDDGYADSNETVSMRITVRNATALSLTEVTARLSVDDPKVECVTLEIPG